MGYWEAFWRNPPTVLEYEDSLGIDLCFKVLTANCTAGKYATGWSQLALVKGNPAGCAALVCLRRYMRDERQDVRKATEGMVSAQAGGDDC